MPKTQPKKAVSKKPKAAPAKALKSVAKKAPVKKAAAKSAPAKPLKKAVAKKSVAKKPVPTVKAKAQTKVAAKATVKKESNIESKKVKLKKPVAKSAGGVSASKPVKPEKPAKGVKGGARTKDAPDDSDEEFIVPRPKGPVVNTPFQKSQREKLQALRDLILDSMAGVAKDTLRSRPEGSEASAFGMHQADAGSDAYDKDFALSLLSQEQDALYEIEEAIKRIDIGTYGICEMTGKPIMIARLEALPFARYTVECQAELERTKRHQRSRVPVTSLFGLTDSEEEDGDGEEAEETPQKPQNEE